MSERVEFNVVLNVTFTNLELPRDLDVSHLGHSLRTVVVSAQGQLSDAGQIVHDICFGMLHHSQHNNS